MAQTSYQTNDPESVKLWRKRLAREALKATWIGKFIGESDESLIQILDETSKGAGDKVTVTLRMQLVGDGVLGDGTVEGNEEALATYTDAPIIDQLRHAVRSKGKMVEQRITFKIREESQVGLKDWWAGRMDTSFFNQIAGYTPQTDVRYTGLQASIAPDASHLYLGAVANEQSLSSANPFDLTMIDNALALAKLATPAIRPIMVDGNEMYVCFLHTWQVVSMRTNTSAGQWLDIQKAATTGDGSKKNPIFTGALGVYNNVILHESSRVPHGVNSATGAPITTVRRAILCGAQAAAICFGEDYSFEKWDWNEELFDYGNQLGVEAGCIHGIKKLRFNGADFSTIAIPTYSNTKDV
jgi:N4-gp56 family major capsid protein